MASPTEISVSQLNRLIGTPDCPLIVDVRIDEDFEDDPRLIPSAIRYPFTEMETLAQQCKDTKIVIYCQKGLKISQGAAALLRSYGISAEILNGGQFAWRDAKLQLVPANKIPKKGTDNSTLWVTRHRPKIDRIACPWLIKRFVDPSAQFLFVSPSQVQNVADRFNATPFDTEGGFWSHRGDQCSFDIMIEEFKLHSQAMNRLALIIRAADTNRHDLAPEAAGLVAVSLGLSRMYKDDLAQLAAGMQLYDALYRWSRDATDEGHDWPSNVKKS